MPDITGLPRVTPSKLVPHQAPRGPAWITGPAGIAVPPARARFRKTLDVKPLAAIAAAAADAHEAQQLPQHQRTYVVHHLEQDLLARFPPAEMAICKKHGFTVASARAVTVRLAGDFRGWHGELSQPVMVIPGHQTFELGDDGLPAVPAAARAFFQRLSAVRAARQQDFTGAAQWAERNHPSTWAEIEAEFPMLGAWMTRERESARG